MFWYGLMELGAITLRFVRSLVSFCMRLTTIFKKVKKLNDRDL
jgi:hypothetical protein